MTLPVLVFALTEPEIERVRAEPVLQLPMKTDEETPQKDYMCLGCPVHKTRVL